jgi:hypothetical protein
MVILAMTSAEVTRQNMEPMYDATRLLWMPLRSAGGPDRHTGGLMDFGGSIFLIAVGLILALAVNISVYGVDLQLVGWILTAVGALGLLLSVALYRRRRAVVVEPTDDYPPPY